MPTRNTPSDHPARHALSRRTFLQTTCAGATALAALGARAEEPVLPGVPNSPNYPETQATLQIPDPARFKILQVTDSHFFQKREEIPDGNARTVADWKKMVDLYQPDVVCMTGDLWPDNPDNRGAEFQQHAIGWLDELGVPWTFSWGNHDQLDDYVKGHDAFREGKHSLYRGGTQSGNYTVSIQNQAGSQVWELVCINTHRHGLVGPAYDWLAALVETRKGKLNEQTPGFAMFHIPVAQYAALLTNGRMSGIVMEKVCNEQEQGEALKLLAGLGSIRATFCGHDHVNDYSGVAEGIELVYGRSSGWNAYGWNDVRKGGKLITVNCETGTYAWESVFPDGLRWHPKPGERIEETIDEPWINPRMIAQA